MTQDQQYTTKRTGPGTKDQRPTARRRRSERGYILLMLMLFVTLLAIAAGALAPTIAFQVKRDREEEMIHRGVQYSRAIRRYVKKTGRYPARLEDLENSNNVRFLRKRYKDPITGKDFKILHVGEVQLMGTAGIAGAAAIGSGGLTSGASPLGAATTGGGPGAAASMLLGAGQNAVAAAAAASSTAAMSAGGISGQDATPASAGSSQGSDQSPDQSKSGATDTGAGSEKLSAAIFGGGPIVGVASVSKAASIREFNHKNHYNQWQFVYDPTMDRGGLITTPAQPPLQVAAPPQQPNQSGQNPSAPSASGLGMESQSPPPTQPTPQQ